MGLGAIADAMNPWDLVKGFARGMRWLLFGVKHREKDISYKVRGAHGLDNLEPVTSADHEDKNLPIADEFRRSRFGMPSSPGFVHKTGDEQAGLIAHAQPNPLNLTSSGYIPARQRYDANGQDISSGGRQYASHESSPDRFTDRSPVLTLTRPEAAMSSQDIGMAIGDTPEPYQSHVQQPYPPQSGSEAYLDQLREDRRNRASPSPSQQWANASQPSQPPENHAHAALWGEASNSRPQNEF